MNKSGKKFIHNLSVIYSNCLDIEWGNTNVKSQFRNKIDHFMLYLNHKYANKHIEVTKCGIVVEPRSTTSDLVQLLENM